MKKKRYSSEQIVGILQEAERREFTIGRCAAWDGGAVLEIFHWGGGGGEGERGQKVPSSIFLSVLSVTSVAIVFVSWCLRGPQPRSHGSPTPCAILAARGITHAGQLDPDLQEPGLADLL